MTPAGPPPLAPSTWQAGIASQALQCVVPEVRQLLRVVDSPAAVADLPTAAQVGFGEFFGDRTLT